MKKIVLTGGGTAGHVTPNIALLPRLEALGYEISYIGSYEGIEKKLISDYGIPYYGVSTGKFRRYFDPKNFSDPFRVLKGCSQAKRLCFGLENFEHVILNFDGVSEIGQGFADEVFRVYANNHPMIKLDYENAGPDVERMIRHVVGKP